MRIFLCIALFILTMTSLSVADDWRPRQTNKILNIRGTLVDINYKHHNLTIEEEFTKLTRRFYVPFKPIDQLKLGDEVRVYYRPGTHEAISVKKMTPVEYKKDGQNKGYLLRSEN